MNKSIFLIPQIAIKKKQIARSDKIIEKLMADNDALKSQG
jgi:hypothetical protein